MAKKGSKKQRTKWTPWFTLWRLVLMAPAARGLVAYDCDSEHASYTTIDLNGPEECPTAPSHYMEEETTQIQVVQDGHLVEVPAIACKVAFSSLITICGFDR